MAFDVAAQRLVLELHPQIREPFVALGASLDIPIGAGFLREGIGGKLCRLGIVTLRQPLQGFTPRIESNSSTATSPASNRAIWLRAEIAPKSNSGSARMKASTQVATARCMLALRTRSIHPDMRPRIGAAK